MSKYHDHFKSTRSTPQVRPIPGENMVKNTAGGYGYKIDKWARLERFLILGTEGGTFYANERKLTKENAASVLACIAEDGHRVADVIRDVSFNGRAPRQDEALFAYALVCAYGDTATKQYAFSLFSDIIRIPTHLMSFLNSVTKFRGWGGLLRKAVAGWYNDKPLDKLAYHLVKYRQRYGWTHRDILRLAHPKTDDEGRNMVYGWVTGAVVRSNDDYERISNYTRIFKDREGKERGTEYTNLLLLSP